MATVQRHQSSATSTIAGSSSKTDMNLSIRLRPKAVLINAADFSYGYDNIESLGERYLTPHNVNGKEKPFFDDFVVAKADSKLPRDAVVIKETPVSPSPPSSLVSSPRTEHPPVRAVVRWKDVPDHKGNDEKPKEAKAPKSSSGSNSGHSATSKSATTPQPLKSILKPSKPVVADQNATQTQSKPRSPPTQHHSRRASEAPGLARIPESPREETPAYPPQRLPGYSSSPQHQHQYQHYHQQQPPHSPPSYQQAAYPQYYPHAYPTYSASPPQGYPPQYSSQPSSQRHVATYTNRYRPMRDSVSEYQYRPSAHEKQSGRRSSMSGPHPTHHEADERRGSY